MQRMMQESSAMMVLIKPSPNDCLFGRGRPYQRHPGNIRMLQLVERNKACYQRKETTREEKKHIVKHIIHEMQVTYGGRFLKQRQHVPPLLLQQQNFDTDQNYTTTSGATKIIEESQWSLASNEEIMKKISHCLREKLKGSDTLSTSTSSTSSSTTSSSVGGGGAKKRRYKKRQPKSSCCKQDALTCVEEDSLSTPEGRKITGVVTPDAPADYEALQEEAPLKPTPPKAPSQLIKTSSTSHNSNNYYNSYSNATIATAAVAAATTATLRLPLYLTYPNGGGSGLVCGGCNSFNIPYRMMNHHSYQDMYILPYNYHHAAEPATAVDIDTAQYILQDLNGQQQQEQQFHHHETSLFDAETANLLLETLEQ